MKKRKILTRNLANSTLHNKFKKLDLNEVGMDFDGNSSYPSAMWDEKSVYLKIEIGSAFKPHMNDV